ncbi:O-antigen ligase family protein, partial [Flavobacterium sp.]|uniref:O-antigen ligase family protein n=1 Tax=Flavobacterium sp. TaxID=239 RepID=UPI00374C9394
LYTVFYLDYYNKISGIFSVYYISSGHFGVSLVILASYLLFFKSYNESIIKKEILIIGILLGIFAIYISAARSPLLALLVIFLYFIILKNKYKYIYVFIFLLLLGILSIYVCKEILHLESAFIVRNYSALFEGNTSGREPYFTRAIQIFKDNPLLGGRIMYEDGMYPHNIILELLMSGGILILFLFGLIFIPILKKIKYFLRFSDSKYYVLPVVGLWLQYLILAQTSNNIYSNPDFWYFSSVVIGISINIYNEKIKSNDGSWNPSRNNTPF